MIGAAPLLRWLPYLIGAALLAGLGAAALNWGVAPRRALAECRQLSAQQALSSARDVAHIREALLLQSAHVEQLRLKAQARSAAATTRALRTLAEPIPPPTGHGPEEMTQWLSRLE